MKKAQIWNYISFILLGKKDVNRQHMYYLWLFWYNRSIPSWRPKNFLFSKSYLSPQLLKLHDLYVHHKVIECLIYIEPSSMHLQLLRLVCAVMHYIGSHIMGRPRNLRFYSFLPLFDKIGFFLCRDIQTQVWLRDLEYKRKHCPSSRHYIHCFHMKKNNRLFVVPIKGLDHFLKSCKHFIQPQRMKRPSKIRIFLDFLHGIRILEPTNQFLLKWGAFLVIIFELLPLLLCLRYLSWPLSKFK